MTTEIGDPIGSPSSQSASLSDWAAPYVTSMLGKGEALSNQPYQAYGGPLTAGQSGLQTQAFQGLAGLSAPTAQMGGFTPTSFTAGTTSQDFMSPYIGAALEPQIAEGQRNLLRNLADIYGTGMQQAYTQGMGQFNTEQDRAQQAQDMTNRYGLSALAAQQMAGGVERDIEQQGVAADYAQFQQELEYPYKQVQYQQSLLQGLPIEKQETTYVGPSGLSQGLGYVDALTQLYDAYDKRFG